MAYKHYFGCKVGKQDEAFTWLIFAVKTYVVKLNDLMSCAIPII